MAHGDFLVQPYQFDPESDPDGEAPEEVQTLRRDHAGLVCLPHSGSWQ